MSSSRRGGRKNKGKGKAPASSPPDPADEEAQLQWMSSLMSLTTPPGQYPYAGPPPLHTPPTRRLSPYFQTPPSMPPPPPPPADDVYRPQMVTSLFDTPGSTPGDEGSQAATRTTDPSLSVDDYEVEETPAEPPSRSGKGKAPASSEATSPDRPKRLRTTYTLPESELIANCWADTSQNPERSNFQTEIAFWERVAESYRSARTASMKDHGSEAIRRHWERLMRDCGHFNGIYSNLMANMTSGQNEHMVRDEAIQRYNAQFLSKGFKYWSIYERLKDLPKFRTGMHSALHGKSVRSRLSGQESEGSATPIDLSGDGPHDRPEGAKKAKGRRKGKKSTASDAQSDPQFIQQAAFSTNWANLTQMYTLYFSGTGTPEEKRHLWEAIQIMRQGMGPPPDAPPPT